MQAVGPALADLDAIRDKVGSLQISCRRRRSKCWSLYDAVSNNEDAFNAISGIGQMMAGFGQAMIANTPLANAFGGELAAQFTILKDRGVEIPMILASMQAPLQELWELSKEGKITVDDTTQALLNQAEAQGIVGADMMDTNEQMLAVLGEIRDLFAECVAGGDCADGRLTGGRVMLRAMTAGIWHDQQRKPRDEANAQRRSGHSSGVAAQTGQLAVLTAAQREQIALMRVTEEASKVHEAIGPGMARAAGIANAAIDTIANRRITIPIDFDVADPPTLPGDAGSANNYSEQRSAGHTEFNFNVDGQTLARTVVPHIPGVVNTYVVA